jgi:hypothetical protein
MERGRRAMGYLVCIDPGKNSGVATFLDGNLFTCHLQREIAPLNLPHSWLSCVVCEIPYIYPGGRGKGDGNDLIQVARIAGRLTALVPEDRMSFIYPRSWKGNVPDSVIFNRISSRLTPEERALLPGLDKFLSSKFTGLLGNVLDAVGIGLHRLGRL